eukprot:1732543-Prymnesium_polylepis.1
MYTPEEIPERPPRRPRPSTNTSGGGGRPCPNLDGYTGYDGCSSRSRARHALSPTKSFTNIDPAIQEELLTRLGGEMPRREDGSYAFVHLIVKNGHWHYRASCRRIDYGSFCEEKLAAAVANYARLHPAMSRED